MGPNPESSPAPSIEPPALGPPPTLGPPPALDAREDRPAAVRAAARRRGARGPEGANANAGANGSAAAPPRDRSRARLVWYRTVRSICAPLALAVFPWRATGLHHVPESGGVLLVSNHLSYCDVFFLGFPLHRPLNYVARSTLFLPGLGAFIRSVGGFPIQREGMGASGMKETLRRLRAGGIVTLFPEGTRSRDGRLGPLKPGIAVLVARAGVPVVPVGLAGTFEVWPRSRWLPVPHPVRIHYGPPISPEEIAGMDTAAITALVHDRMADCHAEALRGLRRDLGGR